MHTSIRPNANVLDLYREPERMNERLNMIRLDRNERLGPFPTATFTEMKRLFTADLLSTYPDPTPLYAKVSRMTGLAEDCFFFTNGSDAALRLIFHAFLQKGDTVVLSDPSYAMLSVYAKIREARAALVPYDDCIRLDLQRLEGLLHARPRLLALPNPDQPTGTVVPSDSLRRLIALAEQSGTVVVIDEAYHPFYPNSVVPWVKEFSNLLVTRSFSKAYGLSGLRLGMMIGSAPLVEYASRLRGLHEVNAMAVIIGGYLLDHPKVIDDYVKEVSLGREVLRQGANEMGLGFPTCYANFQLMQVPPAHSTRAIMEGMKGRGYLIKGDFRASCLRDCIRATVGPPDLMKRFLIELKATLGEGREL